MKFRISFLIIIVFLLSSTTLKSQTKRNYKNFSDTNLKVGDIILAPTMHFALGNGELLPEFRDSAKIIAKFIIAHPTFKIEIGAHSDNRGKTEVKILITNCRAQSVVNYLTKELGLSPENFTARGYGSSELLISDAAIKKIDKSQEQGREKAEGLHSKNRRIEIKILKTE